MKNPRTTHLTKRFSLLILIFVFVFQVRTTFGDQAEVEEAEDLISVVMQFDWLFNAQFAGFYQAIEQGYYEAVGLNVILRGGVTTPDSVQSTLDEALISFGSAESNVLLGDASEGADLRVIGTMFQDSPMGWMYLKDSGISEFNDLVDLNVGVHSDGTRVIAQLLLENGADISNFKTFKASHDPSLLLDGKADALQCYYIDEFVLLEQLAGSNAGVFLARDFGYKAYSQVMYTAAETVEEHPEVVRQFLAATKKGWSYAFQHIEETVDLIIEKYNPDIDRAYQVSSLEKIEELMIPKEGMLFKAMDLTVWESGQAYLLKYELIPKAVDLTELIDQRFLP